MQERYIALQVATTLGDAQYSRFQPERNEDVDVWFAGETIRDHHQVKDEILTKSAVKSLVREFRQRNAEFIERGVIRNFASRQGPWSRSHLPRMPSAKWLRSSSDSRRSRKREPRRTTSEPSSAARR